MNQVSSPKQPNQKDSRQKQGRTERKPTGPTQEKSSPSYEAERKTNSEEKSRPASASHLAPSGSNGIPAGQETTLNTSEIQEGGTATKPLLKSKAA